MATYEEARASKFMSDFRIMSDARGKAGILNTLFIEYLEKDGKPMLFDTVEKAKEYFTEMYENQCNNGGGMRPID